MKKPILILFTLLILTSSFGQRIIKGKVVDTNYLPLPGATISLNDETVLGSTDFDGFFEIALPSETKTINFYFVAYEPTKVTISNECDYIEIILSDGGCYLNYSNRKIDRLRKKEINKLNEFHLEAYEKGYFKFNKPCFKYEFYPIKERLDEISKETKLRQKQIKTKFKELNIGDSIQIPYSTSYGSVYSYFIDKTNFKCLIEVEIIGKNRKKSGYNLICKVLNKDRCQYESLVLEGKEINIGNIVEYNMRFFKIID